MRNQKPSRAVVHLLPAVIALVAVSCAEGQDRVETSPVQGGERGEVIARSFAELLGAEIDRGGHSPFEARVLREANDVGELTREAYEEAHDRFIECFSDTGFLVDYRQLPNGLIQRTYVVPEAQNQSYVDAMMAADEECARGTLMVIEALYRTQVGNPDLLVDPDEVATRCLPDAELVDPTYTVESFRADWSSGFSNPSFDPMDRAAQMCFAGAGIAVSIG